MFQGRHFTVDCGGTDLLTQAGGAVLVQHLDRQSMDRWIPPHPFEVGEVIMLRRHTPLVAYKGQIPPLKILQGERLNGSRWCKALLCFLPSINQALLRFLLVRRLAGLKALRTNGIPICHPPLIAAFIEAPR